MKTKVTIHRHRSDQHWTNQDTQEPQHRDPGSEHLDRRQLARRWGTSVSTIRRKEKNGELPTLQLGPRLIRFKLTDILTLEENSR